MMALIFSIIGHTVTVISVDDDKNLREEFEYNHGLPVSSQSSFHQKITEYLEKTKRHFNPSDDDMNQLIKLFRNFKCEYAVDVSFPPFAQSTTQATFLCPCRQLRRYTPPTVTQFQRFSHYRGE